MARAQDGDAGAYRTLLLAITPFLRALVANAHRNPSDIEDIVQDILLSLHTVRHTYDPGRPFRPWLIGIARHRVIDRLRRQGRHAANEVALSPEHEDLLVSPADAASDMFRVRALEAALAALPRGQRDAVTLLKLKQLSLKEAAGATGLSITALKVACHRGMRSLRRL